jgi:hypothetical protein
VFDLVFGQRPVIIEISDDLLHEWIAKVDGAIFGRSSRIRSAR